MSSWVLEWYKRLFLAWCLDTQSALIKMIWNDSTKNLTSSWCRKKWEDEKEWDEFFLSSGMGEPGVFCLFPPHSRYATCKLRFLVSQSSPWTFVHCWWKSGLTRCIFFLAGRFRCGEKHKNPGGRFSLCRCLVTKDPTFLCFQVTCTTTEFHEQLWQLGAYDLPGGWGQSSMSSHGAWRVFWRLEIWNPTRYHPQWDWKLGNETNDGGTEGETASGCNNWWSWLSWELNLMWRV